MKELKPGTTVKVEYVTKVIKDHGGDSVLVVHPSKPVLHLEASVPRSAVTVIQLPIEVGDFVMVKRPYDKQECGFVKEINEFGHIKVVDTCFDPSLARLICKKENLEDGWNE